MTQPAPLRFYVPEPAVRPGGQPDFSNVPIPEAGSVRRPEIDADPESIRDLAFSIIRVLDRNGDAVGPWAGTLTDEELAEGLKHMMTLRAFDARMQMAQRQGKTSFYMQHMGEEAVSCAFRRALEPGDMNFPTYRQAGLLDRRRLSDGRNDEPDLFERRGPAQGPSASGDVCLQGARLLFDFGESRDAIHPGGGLGDGLGDQERHENRGRLDRRRRHGGVRFSRGVGIRLDVSGACRAEHRQQPVGDFDFPGHRSRRVGNFRRARTRFRHSGVARRRQRLSRGPCRRQMGGRARACAISDRRWSNMSPIASGRIRRRTILPPIVRRRNRSNGRSAIPCSG